MRSIIELEKELQEYKRRKKKQSVPNDEVVIETLQDDTADMELIFESDDGDLEVYWDAIKGKYYCDGKYIEDIEAYLEENYPLQVENFENDYSLSKLSKEFKAKQEYVPDDTLKRMAQDEAKKRLMQREAEGTQKLSAKKLDIKVLNQLQNSLVKVERYLIGEQDYCPICNQTTQTAITKMNPSTLSDYLGELSNGNPSIPIKSVNDLDRLTFAGKIGNKDAKISVLNLMHLCSSHESLVKHWNTSGAVTSPAIKYFLDEPVQLSKDSGYKVSNKTFVLSDKDSSLLSWLKTKNQNTKTSRDE